MPSFGKDRLARDSRKLTCYAPHTSRPTNVVATAERGTTALHAGGSMSGVPTEAISCYRPPAPTTPRVNGGVPAMPKPFDVDTLLAHVASPLTITRNQPWRSAATQRWHPICVGTA
jgi:hypothetical protein